MIFIGVDIGKDGGIATLDSEQADLEPCYIPMPVIKVGKSRRELNYAEIYDYLATYKASFQCFMVIEDATTDPKWSKSVTGELVGCRMVFEAFGAGLGIPYEVTKARIWQKEVFKGMNKTDTKMMALTYAKRRFPDEDFLVSDRCKKPHSGIVDALCIAEYARRLYVGY